LVGNVTLTNNYMESRPAVPDGNYSYAVWGDGSNGTLIGHPADSAWTFQCYVRPQTIDAGRRANIFRFNLDFDNGSAQWFGAAITNFAGYGGFQLDVGTPRATVVYDNPGTFNLGQWTHFAFVMPAGPSPVARAYIDGVQVGTISVGAYNVEFNQAQTSLRVGYSDPASPSHSDMDIDDVKLCNEEEYTGDFTPPARSGN